MILTAVYDSVCTDEQKVNPFPGLNEALDVLQYFASRGNSFALQRLNEAQAVWRDLSAHLNLSPSTTTAQDPITVTQAPAMTYDTDFNNQDPPATQRLNFHRAGTGIDPVNHGQQPSAHEHDPLDFSHLPDLWDDVSQLCIPEYLYGDTPLFYASENGTHDYGSMYGSADCALTGENVANFAELSRFVSGAPTA